MILMKSKFEHRKINDSLIGLKVKNIEKIASDNFVYDISVQESQNFLSGFGGIVTKENFAQGMDPHHVAISLDGEPTLYPKIADLIFPIMAIAVYTPLAIMSFRYSLDKRDFVNQFDKIRQSLTTI